MQIGRLYRAVFDRPPDERGWAYWEGQTEFFGASLTAVANYFVGSPEFVNRYGHLDNRAFVRRVYLNVLDREPDPGGHRYWTDMINRGILSRATLMIQFAQSTEFKTKIDAERECVTAPPDVGASSGARWWFGAGHSEVRHHPNSGISRRYRRVGVAWHTPTAAQLGSPPYIFQGSSVISKSCSASGYGSHHGYAGTSPVYDDTTATYHYSAVVMCFTGPTNGRVALHEAVHLWQLVATGHAHYQSDEYVADCVVRAMLGQTGDYNVSASYCAERQATVNRYVRALTTGHLAA